MLKKTVFYFIFLGHLFLILLTNTYAEEAKSMRLLVWGDSLSAAYGIPVEQGWVNLLQKQLGKQVKMMNASISGETTEGGVTRLPAALEQYKPDVMLLELGANDGLRGMRTEVMRKNLKKMIQMAQQKQITVVLLGIKIPPNYGVGYTTQFEKVFADLAEQYSLYFVPFILEGIAMDYSLMQADGLHPNAKAQPVLLKNIMPALEKILKVAEKN
jgi:acyl-CoA thioesterase-1